jgi:hypothetical protein
MCSTSTYLIRWARTRAAAVTRRGVTCLHFWHYILSLVLLVYAVRVVTIRQVRAMEYRMGW